MPEPLLHPSCSLPVRPTSLHTPPPTRRFDDFEEKQFQNERMAAERRARAEAWEWEKEEARRNKCGRAGWGGRQESEC